MQLSLGSGTEKTESREAFARRTIEHAFERNPDHVWTREGLATWYAIPLELVETTLRRLISIGIVVRLEGPPEGYTCRNPHQI